MKSIRPELLDLLERYVADELSEQERIAFETKLETDTELSELLDFYLAFESEKEDFGRVLMKQNLQKVDAEMQKETSHKPIAVLAEEVLQKLANHVQKTVEEVSRWFQPIPEYQVLSTHRSGTLELKTPVLGKDYTNGILTFELEKAGNYLISIENNQRQVVLNRPVEETERKISIEVEDFPMGIYYWKVMEQSEDWMLVGDFLITLN